MHLRLKSPPLFQVIYIYINPIKPHCLKLIVFLSTKNSQFASLHIALLSAFPCAMITKHPNLRNDHYSLCCRPHLLLRGPLPTYPRRIIRRQNERKWKNKKSRTFLRCWAPLVKRRAKSERANAGFSVKGYGRS